ncbi:MarR family transcriptional regulator [Paenibacillus sp. GSMTC-2017]|uniref:MarR family winged helix-turn-helix transcriptional regulator n=1 Tax=Paenibacillus sp. GSMTC-2017 TaxID=2794350 RepID=UPI0018D673DB|nr:MarR family transcriptional regulator [Paenibacillus sp. GSMTC-2017]MBH5319807.1 MarR family transcriptional regulator [Paenibacillus sp. GSMTC-2017]
MSLDQSMLKQLINRYERANFVIERRLNAKLRGMMPGELTVEQFKTLRFLKHNGSSTSSELSEVFCVGKSSITAIITRLSDKGLIKRLPEEKDRRVTNLALTEQGKCICELMEEQVLNVIGKVMEHFDEKEACIFIKTYEKLVEKLLKS